MRKAVIFLCILSVFLPAFIFAGDADKQVKQGEVITNETIIKMVNAKLGDTLIIGKIKSSKTNFDLSVDAIIRLKKAGVSEEVIEAMMGGGHISPSQKGTGLAPLGSVKMPVTGDFFLLKDGKLIEIEEHPGYSKFLRGKAFWTGGTAADCMYIIDGPKASFRIPASKKNLVFISKIKIDPVGIQGGDLFKLATKGEKIRYMIQSGSATSPGAGIPRSEYKTNYESKKNPDDTYTIITKGPLAPGEYAFMWGSTQNASLRVFDFGIDAESQGAQ